MRLLFILIPFFLFASQETYWDDGVNNANDILGKVKGDMAGRINNPITSKSKLYTMDNSQSGDASITCGEEKDIMRVSYSVESGGDISLLVDEDLDLNGNYEKTFNMNGISGVCANGFIRCSSGSWNSCNYYMLKFDGNGLSVEKTNSQLGGCYCINNSCGGLSSNSKQRILNDISGAVAGVTRDSHYYIISNISVNGDYSYIKGKNVNCNGEDVPVGMSESDLLSQTEDKRNEDMDNNDSSYYVLTQSANNAEENKPDTNDVTSIIQKRDNVSETANWDKDNQQFSYEDNGTKVDGGMFVKDTTQIQYCEVEYTQNNTDVFTDNTNRENSTSSSEVKQSKIIECKKDENGNWYCPTTDGQSVKYGCGEVNDFGEVIGELSAVKEATDDFSCSTK